MAIVDDADTADDTVQDALVLAWDRLHQCRDPDRFAAWFLTIVRRAALKQLRRRRGRRELSVDDSRLTSQSAPEVPATDLADLRAALLTGIRQLSPGQREVLLLHDLEGLRHRAIAEALGISEAMSRRHLSDARRRMRDLLPGHVRKLSP